jgi:hypothetical protein
MTGEWQQIFERVLREEEWSDELVEILEFQVVDHSGRTAVIVPFPSLLAGSST